MYFTATTASYGQEVWVYDASAEEEADVNPKVIDINTGASDSTPYGYFAHDGKVYFNADDGTNGQELWVLDTTQDIDETNPEMIYN